MQEESAPSTITNGADSLDLDGIIAEIDQVFLQHAVRYVDFMPTFAPPYVLFAEHTLGISMKVLKPLYKQVYQQFLMTYHQWKGSNPTNTDKDHNLTALWQISRIVLLIKGDLNFVYNARKAILTQSPSLLSAEIQFLAVVFSKHPKSPSGWDHRRWCLQQHLQHVHRIRLVESEVETERELCRDMAEKYPKNYYAWMHRLWLLSYMNTHQLEDEIHYSKEWLSSHVSDHSAVNHLMQLLKVVLSQPQTLRDIVSTLQSAQDHLFVEDIKWNTASDSIKLMNAMLAMCSELILTRPGRESLWCLRRSLLQLATDLLAVDTETTFTVQTGLPLLLSNIALTTTLDSGPSQEGTRLGSFSSKSFLTTQDLIFEEMQFMLHCMSRRSVWDDALQRKHAIRYLLFVLSQMQLVPSAILDEQKCTSWKLAIQTFLKEQDVHIPSPVLQFLQLH